MKGNQKINRLYLDIYYMFYCRLTFIGKSLVGVIASFSAKQSLRVDHKVLKVTSGQMSCVFDIKRG